MTITPGIAGPEYDSPAQLSDSLFHYEAKREIALEALKRAESDGNADAARAMSWELGLIDLNVATDGDPSPYGNGPYEKFAEFYHINEDTVAYAYDRAAETSDVVLRIHYLAFALLRSEPRGKEWIELQRRLAIDIREFVDGCQVGAGNDPNGFAGVAIAESMPLLRRLLERPGVIRGTEANDWAGWILALADASRHFPELDERRRELQRHRWVAEYLSLLVSVPPGAADPNVRTQALQLLDDAAACYASEPLNDVFERAVAETDASLRKHWGESGTHAMKVRRTVAALRRRADFHREMGNGTLTAHFYREARRVVETDRQYFTESDVAELQRAEQAALSHSVRSGEYGRIRIPLSIPPSAMDLTQETPELTVAELVAFAAGSVPRRDELRRQVAEMHRATPLHATISRTIVSHDKVVGESRTAEENLELDVERHAGLLARINGAAIGITVIGAASKIALSVPDLLAPLDALRLDSGTHQLIAIGVERLMYEDFISAVHVLIPRFEDCLRQHLRAIGVDTTRFNPDVGDGSSRTDDASLGALLRAALPDGRDVREYLGDDFWHHVDGTLNSQTSLNLRNDVAHGLARPAECTVETAGLALGLLYQLAVVARQDQATSAPEALG